MKRILLTGMWVAFSALGINSSAAWSFVFICSATRTLFFHVYSWTMLNSVLNSFWIFPIVTLLYL